MAKTFKEQRILFTADTHFWHRFAANFRGFTDVPGMNHTLIRAWNQVVSPDDTVFHLGDFCFSGSAKSLDILDRLNGKIHLIKGNHDQGMGTRVRNRFITVNDYLEVDIIKDGNKTRVVLMHYPLKEWNHQHDGSLHLHGHTHGNMEPLGRSMDVGVDACAGAPVLFDDIASRLSSRDIHVLSHNTPK
jgi:calcineurin-like phosphoesterase family protein